MPMLFLENNFSPLKAKVESLALIKSIGFLPQSSRATEINSRIPEGPFFYLSMSIRLPLVFDFFITVSLTVLLIIENRHKVLSRKLPEVEIKLTESILF